MFAACFGPRIQYSDPPAYVHNTYVALVVGLANRNEQDQHIIHTYIHTYIHTNIDTYIHTHV
jgi:hypothetical protein